MDPETSNWIDSYRMDAEEAKKIAKKVNEEGTARVRKIAEKRLAKAFRAIEKAANRGDTFIYVTIVPLFAKTATKRFCWNFCVYRLDHAKFSITGGGWGPSKRYVLVRW